MMSEAEIFITFMYITHSEWHEWKEIQNADSMAVRNQLSLLGLRFGGYGCDTITTFMMKKLWIIYGLFFDWKSREQKSWGRMKKNVQQQTLKLYLQCTWLFSEK